MPFNEIELIHIKWISDSIRKKLEDSDIFNLRDLLNIDFKEFYKNNNILYKSYAEILKYLDMFR